MAEKYLNLAEPYYSSLVSSLPSKRRGPPLLERPVEVEPCQQRQHQPAARSQVCSCHIQIPCFLPLLLSCVKTLMTPPCSSFHMLRFCCINLQHFSCPFKNPVDLRGQTKYAQFLLSYCVFESRQVTRFNFLSLICVASRFSIS